MQDPDRVNKIGYSAAVKLAAQRLAMYREDAETAQKLTKQKGGRKKQAILS